MSKSITGSSRQVRPTTKHPSAKRPHGGSPSGNGGAKTRPAGGHRPTDGARSERGPARTGAPKSASFRRRHPRLWALLPVSLVVAAIATMVVIKATASSPASASHLAAGNAASSSGSTSTGTSALPHGIVASLSVSPTTLDSVGSPGSVVPPSSVGGRGAVLRSVDGKPEITYVGAEYCPYCAAERWALAVALSRFGTFSNLSGTHSSSADIYPNTQTLSFYGSSYASTYLDFQAVEEATNQQVGGTYQTLQTPTAAQRSLLSTYDTQGSIPFLDIANKYVITGASFSPQVLQGLSRAQIAAQLGNADSPVAQAIDGTANNITAAMCRVTGNQPSSVCDSPAIAAIAQSTGS